MWCVRACERVRMGVGAVTVVMSAGDAPRGASLTRKMSFGVEDMDVVQFKEGVKSVDGDVEEVLSDWWGCRELMQRPTESELGGDGGEAGILGLPDDVMTLIFVQLPRQSLAMTRLVCSSWKRVAEQQEIASLRRKVQLSTLLVCTLDTNSFVLQSSRSLNHVTELNPASHFIILVDQHFQQ